MYELPWDRAGSSNDTVKLVELYRILSTILQA